MDCVDACPFLFAFADHELCIEQYLAVLDHLKVCHRCTEAVAEHERVPVATGLFGENQPVPAELLERVMKRLTNENMVRLFAP